MLITGWRPNLLFLLKASQLSMSKKLSVKLFLAGLWLLCYFPYKEALLVGEDDRVSSLPGEIRHSGNAEVFNLRQQDLIMLNEEDINNFTWIRFDEGDPANFRFNGLAKLDETMDDVVYDDDCFCKISKFQSARYHDEQLEVAIAVHLVESDVEWSQISHPTRPYFWSLSK